MAVKKTAKKATKKTAKKADPRAGKVVAKNPLAVMHSGLAVYTVKQFVAETHRMIADGLLDEREVMQ